MTRMESLMLYNKWRDHLIGCLDSNCKNTVCDECDAYDSFHGLCRLANLLEALRYSSLTYVKEKADDLYWSCPCSECSTCIYRGEGKECILDEIHGK